MTVCQQCDSLTAIRHTDCQGAQKQAFHAPQITRPRSDSPNQTGDGRFLAFSQILDPGTI